MLNARELSVCLVVCRHLKDCGEWLCPEDTLRAYVRRASTPPANASEIDEAIRYLDDNRRIHATRTETGVKYSLTDTGRAWYALNA